MSIWDLALRDAPYRLKKDRQFIRNQARFGLVLFKLGDTPVAQTLAARIRQELEQLPILQNVHCPCCHQSVVAACKSTTIKTHIRGDETKVHAYYLLVSNHPFVHPTTFLDAMRTLARKLDLGTFYFARGRDPIQKVNPWFVESLPYPLSHRSYLQLLGVNQTVDFIYLDRRFCLSWLQGQRLAVRPN